MPLFAVALTVAIGPLFALSAPTPARPSATDAAIEHTVEGGGARPRLDEGS